MKKLLLTTALVAIFGVANAQEQGLIRVSAGLAYGTEIEEMGINFGGEYLITDAISGGVSYTSFFVDDPASFSSFNIDGRYYFLSDGPYVYGMAGVGIVKSKVDLGPFGSVSDSETGINLGAGALFPFSDNLGALTQIKYNTAGNGQLVLQGGLAYTF
ncbi:MAG: hypothetical protein Tsb0034_01600 [Ekhidna sp.]